MDFFAAQEQARKKTRWLVLWFALAVLCIVALAHLFAMLVFSKGGFSFVFEMKFMLSILMFFTFCMGFFLILIILWLTYKFCQSVLNQWRLAPSYFFSMLGMYLIGVILLIISAYVFFVLGNEGFAAIAELNESVDHAKTADHANVLQLSETEMPGNPSVYFFSSWDNPYVFGFSLVVGIGIVAASLYKMRQIARQGGILIVEQLGGRRINRDTDNLMEKRLLNVMDEMAIAAGIPTPTAFVLPEEHGLNALAAGLSTHDSVIAVTRGLLEVMNRDELQGIIAHEISHIVNGDTRLNLKLIGILFGINGVSLSGRSMLKAMLGTWFFTLVVGSILCAIGYIGLCLGRMIQSAVSREREYMADAVALQFTRNPAGLVSALNLLRFSGSQIGHPQAIAVSHLFFGASEKPSAILTSLFATHPPIEERIQRLGGASLPSLPESVTHAQTLLANLPETLRQTARNVTGAKGIVCGLFLSNARPHILHELEDLLPPDVLPVTQELYHWLSTQPGRGTHYRLIWLDLALPALLEATKRERKELLGWIAYLVPEDERASPSECALYSILRSVSLPPSERHARRLRPDWVNWEMSRLLVFIAYAGHADVEMAKAAYQAAIARSPASHHYQQEPFPVRVEFSLKTISQIFSRLAMTEPLYRKKFLEACAIAAQHDGKITPVENELLRAFAQSLDCPAPLV
ncbi:MAG: M48 family metalloprotease [Zoogloeaceae bacterium]|jgi:Zn-dependent protease with chaperone function|nr:M48 family metalloprotease [Zoogloeaceae bacterium]